MSIIRESLQVNPINAQVVSITGKIKVYNFGWMSNRVVVATEESETDLEGILTETSHTFIQGKVGQIHEQSSVKALDPTLLQVPDDGGVKVGGDDETSKVSVQSFFKKGHKFGCRVQNFMGRKPSIRPTFVRPYTINEGKEYYDAQGSATFDPKYTNFSLPAGFEQTSAVGIKTTTIIEG